MNQPVPLQNQENQALEKPLSYDAVPLVRHQSPGGRGASSDVQVLPVQKISPFLGTGNTEHYRTWGVPQACGGGGIHAGAQKSIIIRDSMISTEPKIREKLDWHRFSPEPKPQ
jgi:hypothetical protein